MSVPSGESLVEDDGEGDEQAVGKELRIRTRDTLKTCPEPLFPPLQKERAPSSFLFLTFIKSLFQGKSVVKFLCLLGVFGCKMGPRTRGLNRWTNSHRTNEKRSLAFYT